MLKPYHNSKSIATGYSVIQIKKKVIYIHDDFLHYRTVETIVKQLDFPNCVAREYSSESIKNFTIPSKIGFQDNWRNENQKYQPEYNDLFTLHFHSVLHRNLKKGIKDDLNDLLNYK